MQLVDTHAHLHDGRFRQDLPEVLQRADAAGVKAIINVGFNLASSAGAVRLAGLHEQIYAAVGYHPHDAKSFTPASLTQLSQLAKKEKVVAIGEIGLDFYYHHSPDDVQRTVFIEQLRLAKELNMPVIIHDRDAHQEVLAILKEEGLPVAGGVMHCFSGDVAFAASCLELGLYLSLAGPVTFKQASALAEVARRVPLERLLVETDSPYLAPVPCRGQRNEPSYVAHIAAQLARLRGEKVETVARATSENAQKLFACKV
ncbi:MAG: TatD family hydrolase [Dethiobacter sp.]|nr:TatD family hydrolase [Dethiobacter sp.]